MSTKRRTDGVYSSPVPKGPNQERLCRNCHGPMPKDKRLHNCSHKCSEEWRAKTSPSYMRRLLFKRDKGVCAICSVDTEALKRFWRALPKSGGFEHMGGDGPRNEFLKARGIPWGRATSDWWDADHITPVIEGGGECGIEGFRTLCLLPSGGHARTSRQAQAETRRREAAPAFRSASKCERRHAIFQRTPRRAPN